MSLGSSESGVVFLAPNARPWLVIISWWWKWLFLWHWQPASAWSSYHLHRYKMTTCKRPGDGERLSLETAPFKVGQTFHSLASSLNMMLVILQCNCGMNSHACYCSASTGFHCHCHWLDRAPTCSAESDNHHWIKMLGLGWTYPPWKQSVKF